MRQSTTIILRKEETVVTGKEETKHQKLSSSFITDRRHHTVTQILCCPLSVRDVLLSAVARSALSQSGAARENFSATAAGPKI